MKRLLVPIAAAAVALASLSENEAGSASAERRPAATQTPTAGGVVTAAQMTAHAAATSQGTTITVRSSRFGRILFNAKRQAIYIFENDRPNKTVCYGACAKAWPPVYTNGRPRAANGAQASLLSTIRRRDGRRQVTYAGKALYYYAHEGPGEVRCHNVRLNGGLWWVVGPNGKRRP